MALFIINGHTVSLRCLWGAGYSGREHMMKELHWVKELHGTGVPEIDEQHKALFARLNLLLWAGDDELLSHDTVVNVFTFLEGYMLKHFECEEGHMERRKCSECAHNRVQHTIFIKNYRELKGRLETDGITPKLVTDISRDIVWWFERHVSRIDSTMKTAAADA